MTNATAAGRAPHRQRRGTPRRAPVRSRPPPAGCGRRARAPLAPALGGRCGAPPRRFGSGRRGMPDGSVPIVIRAGSRRAGSPRRLRRRLASDRSSATTARRRRSDRRRSDRRRATSVRPWDPSAARRPPRRSPARCRTRTTTTRRGRRSGSFGRLGHRDPRAPHRSADRSSAAATRSRPSRN